MNEITIKENDFLRQFEAKVDGKLAKIEFATQEKKVFLTKLNVPEEIKVKDPNFKDDFIKAVLHHVDRKNLKVVPTNPEIVKFVKDHKEYRELLPAGIRI